VAEVVEVVEVVEVAEVVEVVEVVEMVGIEKKLDHYNNWLDSLLLILSRS
jgi:hypothetical protein